MTTNLPVCLVIVGCCTLLQADEPRSGNPRWLIERDGPQVVVRIPSQNGVVTWTETAAALTEVADFDGDVLSGAVSFGEIDLSSRGTRWGLRALNVALPDGIAFRAERDGNREWQLRIDIDLDELEESTRDLRQQAREWVAETVDGDATVEHGLKWHAAPEPMSRSRIVILVHGYTCNGANMCALADALTGEGYQCALMDYPNDGPIRDAAEFLRQSLEEDERLAELLAEDASRSVTLITHSMGGLAARWMIERGESQLQCIRQLIMIAPPSQGSNIARLPGALDAFENWVVHREFDPVSFIEGSFADGLDEAHSDLRPDSRFLRELNACPRCEDVEYTILLGTDGVVSEEGLAVMRAGWGAVRDKSRIAQFAAPRVEAILDDPQELMEGQGDGLVAVSRGRLEGVEDVVLLPFNHGTPCWDLDSAAGQEILATLLDRLAVGTSEDSD